MKETVKFGTNQRVKAHPTCDCFMQGDIHGEIEKITHDQEGKAIVHVRMDRSKKLRKFTQDLLLLP